MAGLRTGNRIIGERVGTTMNEHPYLQEVLILLVALLVFVPLFQRLRFGEMLGYLTAGVGIGPSVLGLETVICTRFAEN